MFIAFSTCDDDGQFTPGVAVEIKTMKLYGLTNDGILFDICHLDGEWERILMGCQPYSEFHIGEGHLKTIMHVSIVDYPACNIITREEFRAMTGQHMTLNEQGYFVDRKAQ
jgi:hypothetical protein